jgi:hypothetical protein
MAKVRVGLIVLQDLDLRVHKTEEGPSGVHAAGFCLMFPPRQRLVET